MDKQDAGGKRCPNIPGEGCRGEEMPKHIWRESLKGRSQEWFEILYFWEFCLSISFEHYFENWVELWEFSLLFFEDISFSVQLARNEMWGDFVVLSHRPIWSAWQQREVSISLDDIIFNVYLIRCMKLCVLQIHTLLLVSSCCFIQFIVRVSVYAILCDVRSDCSTVYITEGCIHTFWT